jgi:ABC-type multidrug transport system permease subunit
MTPATALSSISSNLRVTLGSALIMFRERWFMMARGGYLVLWTLRPIFDLAIAALIHASGRSELVAYAVVGITANSFIFASIFWVGEILDRERMRGTLPGLFLSPSARMSWLGGFALAGAAETLIAASVVLAAGMILFGVSLNVAPFSLIVVSLLFLISLGGLGFVFSAIGLLVKQSNALSNLVSPLVLLFGGIYFPVSELPIVLRVVARMLPIGYATEALALATLEARSVGEMLHLIVPLALFALITPVLGYLSIRWVDRLIRHQGTLDLY